jgi:phenylalanyl-tRNA synthetase beta chain
MQVSYNWLKDCVDFDYDPETLGHKLTMAGVECARIEPLTADFDNVVVGKVVTCETHPNNEALKVCGVDYGGDESATVVCGAPNCREGMKSPLALPGARLGEHTIKTIDKYGVKSAGMLCSEAELGLSDDHSGILELDTAFKTGSPVKETLGLIDFVIHLDLTPNRPDCLSTLGIARDVAAIAGSPLRRPEIKLKEVDAPANEQVEVEIADPDACPRYAARVIENVRIGTAPWWIRQRLLAAGIRSINSIVDITNYVMLEYGHPLHAFDFDNFSRPKVLVRRARPGERFTTLDDQERELTEDVLLITDGERPVAIGGIMGGQYSEVSAETKRVLLESAYFDPRTIRRGRRAIELTSESQDRFERGADPNIVITAIDRAADLISRYAEGEVLSGVIDCYPKKIEPLTLNLRPSRVNEILAAELSSPQMIDILNSLELKVTPGKELRVEVPTFRPDVTREIDLIEEIARIHGYDNIPVRLQSGGKLQTRRVPEEKFADQLRQILLAQGYNEAIANSLVDPKLVDTVNPGQQGVEVLNPISEDLRWLRPHLLTSLLLIARHNLNHRIESVKLFEIGNTFSPVTGGKPTEAFRLGLVLSGSDAGENWAFHPGQFSIYDIIGTLEVISGQLNSRISYSPASSYVYTDGAGFEASQDGETIGSFGEVDRKVLKAFGIKSPVILAELDYKSLFERRRTDAFYHPLPRFPASERDLAVIVAEEIVTSEMLDTIAAAADSTLKKTVVFDVYRGKQIGKGFKSVAFRLIFLDESKTLTDEQIDRVIESIVAALESCHGAKLRS